MSSNRWIALSEWFEQRPLRERVILLSAICVVMVYVWMLIGFDALASKGDARRQQLLNLEEENLRLSQQHAILMLDAEEEPNTALERQIARLRAQNDRLDTEVGAMSVTLVEPERMAMVLSRVMANQPSIQLVSVQNKSAEQLFFRAVDSGEPLVVYKHGLRLSLSGTYLDSLQYLADIEDLGVRFFWETAEFSVAEYPNGKLSLEVFTLSTKEQLIDV